jgi:hypothetical protein
MHKVLLVLLFNISLLSCGRQSGNQKPSESVTSSQANNPPPEPTQSHVADKSDFKPAFDRALLAGIWWRADEHDPSATFFISDSLFNYVDQNPESFFKYVIHYDTLIVLTADSNISVIKKLTKDSLIMNYYNDHTEKYIHTEPK